MDSYIHVNIYNKNRVIYGNTKGTNMDGFVCFKINSWKNEKNIIVDCQYTYTNWERRSYIISRKPDIIIINQAAFHPTGNVPVTEEYILKKNELVDFLQFVSKNTNAQLIMYTNEPTVFNRYSNGHNPEKEQQYKFLDIFCKKLELQSACGTRLKVILVSKQDFPDDKFFKKIMEMIDHVSSSQ